MRHINEITKEEAIDVKYILMDIDDTITKEGKLLVSSYTALWRCKEEGIRVIPVTGRPAGWCDLIAREWPVDGVVGENGALAFWEEPQENKLPVLRAEYHPNAIRNNHPVLKRVRDRALAEIVNLRDAKDQFARLFDIALDFAEEEPVLPLSDAEKVCVIASEEGAMAKVSSIHVNIWMGNYDKLSMTERFLVNRFGWEKDRGAREVVFVGDSPNDEPMFVRFPLACGVANVIKYGDLIKHHPAFVASKECGDGFSEIVDVILKRRHGC
jgi:HAD superfamily hydrolase (TIGR01484 family)